MAFLGSLGLSAADSLFSGASDALFGGIKAKRNWKYKKKEMELQQQYNVENMERQYGYQVDMLNRQNQWNAPTNQVSMWRQAGISPTAVFGSGNGGVGLSGTPSGPSSSNPSASGNMDNSQATKSAIFSEAKRLQNETKVAASVVDKNEADAAAARAAAARDQADADTKNLFRDDLLEGIRLGNLGKGFENRIAEQNAKLKEATTPLEIEKATASLRNLVEDTNLKREQINEILSRIRLNEEYVKTEGYKRMDLRESANLKNSQAYKTDIEAHTEEMIQDYKVAMAREGVEKIKADTAEAKARAKKVDAEIERIGKENNLTDAQIASIKDARREAWARYMLDAGKRASEEAREWISLAKSSLKDGAKLLDPNNPKSWDDPVTGKKLIQ
jgi:hypothetical protein